MNIRVYELGLGLRSRLGITVRVMVYGLGLGSPLASSPYCRGDSPMSRRITNSFRTVA